MARHTYVGLGPPAAAVPVFQGFRAHVAELRKLQARCKPFGRDYLALAIAIDGLETAAYHFTRRAHFYGSDSDSVGLVRPRPPGGDADGAPPAGSPA